MLIVLKCLNGTNTILPCVFLELLKYKAVEIFYLLLILPDMIIIREHGNVPCSIIEMALLPLNCALHFYFRLLRMCAIHVLLM